MYLAKLQIENFRCFGHGNEAFELELNAGLTAFIGENDSGKTAVMDALRFALGTTDQEWYRLEASDFHQLARAEIKIRCEFRGLREAELTAFAEYLTYGQAGTDAVLHVNWSAIDTGEERNGRPYRKIEVKSGKDANGPSFSLEVREFLRATYLRPLRDAEAALSAGRGSRLSAILHQNPKIKAGAQYNAATGVNALDAAALKALSVLGIGDLANALLGDQQGVIDVRANIDAHLEKLTLTGESIKSNVKVSGTQATEDARLRQLLEKLDLSLSGAGKPGLGSNNLLFMACELLLLAEEEVGSRLLLIEEPEAHLHAQRQLRVMKYMQERSKEKGVQILVTTHSPNLASAIDLSNIVLIHDKRAYSLAQGKTKLQAGDYRFLERFLDSTKANLFFAKGVLIVEGDAENILLPTLANLIGRDFTHRGVSIVNVGGVGLRRYTRIFQRAEPAAGGTLIQLKIPVSCITDLDVMPNCAPEIIGKGPELPPIDTRRWRVKSEVDLVAHRATINERADGQSVKTFVSDEWTLEYNLALGPAVGGQHTMLLGEDVFIAAELARHDDAINNGTKAKADIERDAAAEYVQMKAAAVAAKGSSDLTPKNRAK